MHLIAAERREHLLEFGKRGPGRGRVLDVPYEQRFVGLPVEAAPPRVRAGLAEESVEAARQQVAGAAPLSGTLDNSLLPEDLKSWGEVNRDRLLAMDEVDEQEVLGGEGGLPLATDLLEEAQELGVLDLAVKREPH